MIRRLIAAPLIAAALFVVAGWSTAPAPGPGHRAYAAGGGGGGGSTCTDGVNCYCDTVSDPSLLWCEDWEDLDYYEATSKHFVKSPAGQNGWRGGASQFYENYSQTGAAWFNPGEPASPRIGFTCQNIGQGVCTIKEWCSAAQGFVVDGGGADCWQGNGSAPIDIQRTDDYKAEIGSLTLTGGRGVTADVGHGRAHMAFRNGPGNTAGIVGGKSWTRVTEIGVTQLVAFSSNLASTGILNDYWKGHEFGDCGTCEWWIFGNMLNVGSAATFPFRNYFWHATTSGGCSAAIAGKVLIGTANCDGGKLYFGAVNGSGVGQYNQATDWPFGTWGCVQGHISGLGTTNLVVKVWFNGELIIHLSGVDGTVLVNQNYGAVALNNYSNANQAGGVPTTATAFRLEDNIHVRNGPPVSCSQIGWS